LNAIENKVKEIINNTLIIDDCILENSTRLVEDMDMDSLEAMEVVIALEEEFDINLKDESVTNASTIQDIIDNVHECLN